MEGLMMLESPSAEGGSDQQQLQQRLQQMQAKKIALESSTGILELALAEFPGCALFHLYYLESLADYVYQCEGLRQLNGECGAVGMEVDDRQATLDRLSAAFEIAWQSVGRGTHVNEGMIVSEIYRLHGSFLLFRLSSVVAELKTGAADVGMKSESEINTMLQQLSTLFQKWSKTPMGEGSNDEMMQDLEYLWDEACSLLLSLYDGEQEKLKRKQDLEAQKVTLWANIDGERKKTSSLMNILSSHENEVDVAMSNEGIALPKWSLFPHQPDVKMGDSNDSNIGRHAQSLKRISSKWNQILLGDEVRFLVGLGGSETSRAFLKSASILQAVLQCTYQDKAKKGNVIDSGHSPLEDHVATYKYSLISSMYERALSECPTVESLWVSYMDFLRGEWIRLRNETRKPQTQQQQELHFQLQQEDLSSALQSTSHRAIRNCPYSSSLFEIRMTTLGLTSMSNLEPDDITAVTQEATELGFLDNNRGAMLHLRLVAILVVKRRLLGLVSLETTATVNGPGKDYDAFEEMGSFNRKKSTNGAIVYQSLNPTVMEEVQDLLEDIRDMFDEADTFLFKSHPTWSEGRVSFWKHRALTEAYALCPIGLALKKSSQDDDEMAEENEAVADKEAIRCFEKLVKAQKPSHPDSWREYIRYVSASHLYLVGNTNNSTQSQPDGIAAAVSTLRITRGLYHRAMSYVKKAGQETNATVENEPSWMVKGIDSTMSQRDYDAALSVLSREYLEFERTAGSEESLSHALTLVRSKLADWNPPLAPVVAMATPTAGNLEESHGKRKIETNNSSSMPENGPSVAADEEEHDTQSKSKRAKVKTNLKQPKKADGVHKVRLGNMEYPAHPYTIHVSKLNKATQEMDLVDAFRPEFGAIVHAKIIREKLFGKGGHHTHGESKCSGLIQFEDRMSVEQALLKDGELKVGGKLIKIQRSHMPAVGLVPSGMHRVNPKGEGKMSKRNNVKKGSTMKVDTNESMDTEEKGKKGRANSDQNNKNIGVTSPSAISLGVLSFKPRGMRKAKISLKTNKKQE